MKRVAVARKSLQQNTSISRVFVLGALVPAMLLVTWCVQTPFLTGSVGNPTTEEKKSTRTDHVQ